MSSRLKLLYKERTEKYGRERPQKFRPFMKYHLTQFFFFFVKKLRQQNKTLGNLKR